MKKSFLILFLALSVGTQAQKTKDPILLKIGKENVSLSEFEAIYNKNNNIGNQVDLKSPNEYLELFINYKLKVKEAEALGLDTIGLFKRELEGYVNQLASPYLVDRNYTEDLVKEAYNRLLEDVRVSHILIRVNENAAPEDTLKAWNRIQQIYKNAINGVDFAQLAKSNSEDPSVAQNGGDVGYFTAFRMVYPFETAAYNTKVGEISIPVRTSFGYHVLKVSDRRPAVGEMKAAHIMIKSTADEQLSDRKAAEEKINEIYKKALEGEHFEQLARTYSEDQGSAMRGGELPQFGAGRMVPEFEKAAFSIEKDGLISRPVKTQYGWHIIKRIERKKIGSFKEEEAEIRKKVERDRRGEGSRSSLAAKLHKEYNVVEFKENSEIFESLLDSSFFKGQWKAENHAKMKKPVFTLHDKMFGKKKMTFTQGDFAQFLEANSRPQMEMPISILKEKMYRSFIETELIDYEYSILEYKYPEYKALVREYRDGILLFELMDRMVWKKAVSDSAGLEAYYETRKNEFMWDERIDATMYLCSDAENASMVVDLLHQGSDDSTINATVNEKTRIGVQIRKGKFSREDDPALEAVPWGEGISPITEFNGTYYVVNTHEILSPQVKTLAEARGIITSAYQLKIEEEWLRELRKKYKYKVNHKVLDQVKSAKK
jgi:peptidyl-prolyl cis-trans isomerase SurA